MADNNQLLAQLLGYGRDVAQGASNSIAGNISAPVDGLAWALRKAGVPMPSNPMGGSDWMAQRGLTPQPQNRLAGLLGEFGGMAGPMVAAAKAPQIANSLLRMADNAMVPRTMNPQTGAVVWHGSPHKFDAFDAGKIGTGEGAQVYGNGLYLADTKAVADEYASKLSKSIVDFSNKTPSDKFEIALQKSYQELADRTQTGSKGTAVYDTWAQHARPVKDFMYGNTYAGVKPMTPEKLERTLAYRDAANRLGRPVMSDTGSLYKVDLPDEHIAKMLDWDKGGEKAWKVAVEKFGSPRAASDALQSQGIPGIRYLDGGSRGAGTGSSNYVVFPGNENMLNILERNGKSVK